MPRIYEKPSSAGPSANKAEVPVKEEKKQDKKDEGGKAEK